MKGAAKRVIKLQGSSYTVRNASGGDGARDVPSYSDDGTLTGVLENRQRATRTETGSDGESVESQLEVRAIVDGSVTIREAGDSGSYPTELVHPDGRTYEVVSERTEDSGVTVLSVVRD